MTEARLAGRGAAARKYDLLTALGAQALSCGPAEQRIALRLITLLTARYNWQRDELTIGQREIARLWSCDERTVKREMARLRERGWLVLRRPAARGRVSLYGLDPERILADSRPGWEGIGPDFIARQEGPEASGETAPAGGQVVPFPGQFLREPSRDPAAPPLKPSGWSRICQRLSQEDPAIYTAWYARLDHRPEAGGALVLQAPGRFIAHYVETHLLGRLQAAATAEGYDSVRILPDG